jgi:DNA-binding transcriptional LysR family regulator
MRMGPLDLKLLIIFDAVMTERSITRAARRIGMSQPALSNALARLRDVLDDRLFIRGSDGMRPTPRALELAVPVAHALRQLQAAFDQRTFVPAEAERTFRLSMSPHASTVLLPSLLERLRRTAPGVRIRILAKNNTRIVPMLDSNEIDFVVGSFLDLPKRFSSVELFRDEFVCVMRRDHPMSRGPMTLDRFNGAHHVLITATGEEGSLFDDILRDLGYVRPISLIVNEYLAGLLVIARTDLITGLFSRIFHIGESFRELALQSMPLPIAPLSIRLAWHPGLRNDPAYDWLRDEIIAVSGEIASYERPAPSRATG